jgi:hypothetical protein
MPTLDPARTHLTVDRVRSSHDATSRVQGRVNACLGDGNSLLFHDFVYRHSIDVGHLVKLVNADDPSVS